MKTWKVTNVYHSTATVEIEAETEEEALQLALEMIDRMSETS